MTPSCTLIRAILPVALFLFPRFLAAQAVLQETVQIDSIQFVSFLNKDTGYSNHIATDKDILFRKVGLNSTTSLLQADKYYMLVQENLKVKSRFQLDREQVKFSYGEEEESAATVVLSAGKAQINASETWFNGEWIKLPEVASFSLRQHQPLPAGALFYSPKNKSLVLSDGNSSRPAYWEYADGNEINPSVLLSNWASDVGFQNLPLLRLRHPLNTSGIQSGNTSIDRDFSIIPYQYGMAIDYNGVVECWVGEFSIHKGLYYNIDVEGNGGIGWGGILWVGDDLDVGGIRATSRNAPGAFYSEISSETFEGKTHGPLRLRVIGDQDQFEFVTGKRGSANAFLSTFKAGETTTLAAGADQNLALHTSGVSRVFVSKEGQVGVGVSKPTSTLDIYSPAGYSQLRLRNSFTPAGSTDTRGETGDIAYDNSYFYLKTAEGWKRSKLESF